MVEYYGSPTPLKNIAAISVPEATQLLIKPFEQSVLKFIEKAFQESKIQATPRSDGKTLRLILPADEPGRAGQDGRHVQDQGRGGQGEHPQQPAGTRTSWSTPSRRAAS